MFCQHFRFAGSDLQSTANPLDIENKGMIRCICEVNLDFVLPCPIRGNMPVFVPERASVVEILG